MKAEIFSKKIISWYHENKRSLPWRATKDPYKIWLSEIILQQTRVAQGLPYYEKFVAAFPTVKDLAKASEQEVLRLWQGLGYYTRARNLHRCAKEVVSKGGKFPQTYHELLALPGIGQYTAAAIASFSFQEPVAVVDGNVYRVLARVFGFDLDIASPEGKKFFFEQANKLLDREIPDQFNQAMMEFGAMHCTPQSPDCSSCIFSKSCIANTNSLQQLLPVKSKKIKIKKRYLYYFVIEHEKKYLMRKRTAKDIWTGLYDFYLVESNKPQKVNSILLKDSVLQRSKILEESGPLKHVLSHQHLYAYFITVAISSKKTLAALTKNSDHEFYSPSKISQLPKPVLITRFLDAQGILR